VGYPLKRKKKIDEASAAIAFGDFDTAEKLVSEVFHGASSFGKHADPGMEGSLLYHMAMVTKMAAEPRLILEELKVEAPDVDKQLLRFYNDFVSDVNELAEETLSLKVNSRRMVEKESLGADEKIGLFRKLTQRTHEVEDMLSKKDSKAKEDLQNLFQEWAKHIVEMRLRQEYETIRGFLIIEKLAGIEIARLASYESCPKEIWGRNCQSGSQRDSQSRKGEERLGDGHAKRSFYRA
jgi:hypothetical protein